MEVKLFVKFDNGDTDEIILKDEGESKNFRYFGIGDWKNKDQDSVIGKVGFNKESFQGKK
jgi:hypothetical protein